MAAIGELPDPVDAVQSEIAATEQAINTCFYRLEVLQKGLKYRPMTNEERKKTEKDIAEIKRCLLQEEKKLRSLKQRGARVSMMIGVIILIGSFLVFGLYRMYVNVLATGVRTPTTLNF